MSRRPLALGLLSLFAAVGIVVVLALHRNHGLQKERDRLNNEAAAGPRVQVTKVKRSAPQRTLELTGDAVPYSSATLYAKVSGYLTSIAVDKGDLVRKGQLLAVISSPETDHNYQSARANAVNLRRIASRYRILLRKKLVSPQEAEGAFASAKSATDQERELLALVGYERITAPFDGKVTARFVDPGALIQNASGAVAGANPVVTVSDTTRLRVYAYVDQRDAGAIRPGLPAEVYLVENPTHRFPANVARQAGLLSLDTRMLLTEIDVDNRSGAIVPGSLLKVALEIETPRFLEMPAAALVLRQGKQYAGVIRDGRLELRPVAVIENDGRNVRFTGRLEAGEQVGLDLGARVASGEKVRAVVTAEQPTPAQGSRQPSQEHGDRKEAPH